MGKSLIITEKPSVAVEFAKVLQVSGRKDGYIENDKYVITWCVGHLVGMVYPEAYDEKYKKWKGRRKIIIPQCCCCILKILEAFEKLLQMIRQFTKLAEYEIRILK